MPTPKYYGQPDPIDNVPMNWSAHPEGLPIRRGDAPSLMRKPQLNQAGAVIYARSKCLRIPEDIEEYEKILDWVANQTGVQPVIERKVTDTGWLVWLTWYDVRGTIPENPKPGVAGR